MQILPFNTFPLSTIPLFLISLKLKRQHMVAHFTGGTIRPNNAKKKESESYIKQWPYQSKWSTEDQCLKWDTSQALVSNSKF